METVVCPSPRLGKVVNRDKIRNEGMRKYFESARKDTATASKTEAEPGNQPTEQVTWNTSLGPYTISHSYPPPEQEQVDEITERASSLKLSSKSKVNPPKVSDVSVM